MTDAAQLPPLDASVLPAGIRARVVDGINGLRVHLLEAGEAGQPLLVLLHGFPEIAYSWRKGMSGSPRWWGMISGPRSPPGRR